MTTHGQRQFYHTIKPLFCFQISKPQFWSILNRQADTSPRVLSMLHLEHSIKTWFRNRAAASAGHELRNSGMISTPSLKPDFYTLEDAREQLAAIGFRGLRYLEEINDHCSTTSPAACRETAATALAMEILVHQVQRFTYRKRP